MPAPGETHTGETEATPRSSIAPSIIVPTFNNAGTLADVLNALCIYNIPILVVDDGSTDETPDVLDRWRCANPDATLQIERHTENHGKAQALRTGFKAAALLDGVTHAVTIDADAQHDPADIGQLIKIARHYPLALVLGVRETQIAGCPGRCLLGRRVANALVRVETLIRLNDTQCGLRIYPLDLVGTLHCSAERFDYETEIIVRTAWAGCEILQAPVSCVYDVPGGRVSHWRPVVDSLRNGLLHVRLLARSFLPVPHMRWPCEADEFGAARRRARRAVAWISPATLWREMRYVSTRDSTVPASLAVGAFVGCSPFYGLHAWLSLYIAWRLRLHPLPAVVGSFISTPPIGLIIIGASIQLGHLLLTGHLIGSSTLELSSASWWKVSGHVFGSWLLGSAVVGVVVASVVYLISSRAARIVSRSISVGDADHDPA